MSDTPAPPSLSALIQQLTARDRLRVDSSASTTDISQALRTLADPDRDEPGRTRLVRGNTPTAKVSDLLRRLRDEEQTP
jgi:hypothetical protein